MKFSRCENSLSGDRQQGRLEKLLIFLRAKVGQDKKKICFFYEEISRTGTVVTYKGNKLNFCLAAIRIHKRKKPFFPVAALKFPLTLIAYGNFHSKQCYNYLCFLEKTNPIPYSIFKVTLGVVCCTVITILWVSLCSSIFEGCS